MSRTDLLVRALGEISAREAILWGLVLAGCIEAATLILRFGLDLQATRDTRSIARFTMGLRVHHGYLGVLLLLLSFLGSGWARRLGIILGIGLLASDLVHHFLVLWPITGSPQFDLRYPKK